ncbi:MAG: amidase [Bryobacterales bacterium]|nr:amidase [Bryobacterales bacterium]
MSEALCWLPVSELASLLKRRKLSPVELVQACLQQTERMNPKVKAFLTITAEQALDQARAAEREIRGGRYRGPLHGIPYAVKDLIATKGIRTTNGSKVTAQWVPDHESTVTTRLHAAGAILLGKLNLLEFAMGSGQKGLQGPARNPWDLAYSPSGSSSGSGAALAARMVPLTLGSDTGGSIRGPAKSCGVVGLKPTYGRVSLHGVTTLSWTLDHVGPMARSVADAAWMLQAIAGFDERDPYAAQEPVPDYSKPLKAPVRGLRVGVPKSYFFNKVHPDTNAALQAAMETLRKMGVVLVDVNIPQAPLYSTASAVILASESAAFHRTRLQQHAELLDPLVRERLEAGATHTAVDYIHALRLRTVLLRHISQVFEKVDILLLPAGNAAPRLEEEIVGTDLPPDPPPAPRPDTFNLANVTGIPSLVLPCGFTPSSPRLPLGIQFCGRHFEEATLLRLGHAYQLVTDWHNQKPPIAT